MHVKTLLSLAVPALAFLGGVAGVPSRKYSSYDYDLELKGTNFAPDYADLKARHSAKPALRIMTLGASIVSGVGSSTGNGFRKPLRDQLRYKGWLVDMVGSKQNRNITDRDFRSYPWVHYRPSPKSSEQLIWT
ncbi:hypothetical protein IWW34DRAFT_875225 [Fusarium oxysporum f. sp. albedinis]|nr:hypothetical protein IWW34DRAFT_875225 [Fusarium oxysporum f. sp. albedinis]KAK2484219.1 hypothetical protein H9L39_06011 [Fusarium oxysporum f. sp. albedinis]